MENGDDGFPSTTVPVPSSSQYVELVLCSVWFSFMTAKKKNRQYIYLSSRNVI